MGVFLKHILTLVNQLLTNSPGLMPCQESWGHCGLGWSAPTELFIHLKLRRAERTSFCCIGLKEKEVVGSVPSDLASTVKLSSTPSSTSGKLERSSKVPHWIK